MSDNDSPNNDSPDNGSPDNGSPDSAPDLSQSRKMAEANQKFLIPATERKYEKYFQKITELKAGDVIVNVQCKLCNHPLRAEAEAKWEITKGNTGRGNYHLVTRYINEKIPEGGVKLNVQNVMNHLSNHYEQQAKRMWMREYGQHMADIMNYKLEKDQTFELLIQAHKAKLLEAAADPNLEPHRQSDMMTKHTKSILDIAMVQAKLRGEIDSLEVYKEKFQTLIINYIINEVKDGDQQRQLLERLEEAKQSLMD